MSAALRRRTRLTDTSPDSHLVQRWASRTSQVGVCNADVSAAGVGRFAEVRMDQLVSMEGTSDYVRREGA